MIDNFHPLVSRNDIGALWENFLIIERLKRNAYLLKPGSTYFWRTYTGAEIDYVPGTVKAYYNVKADVSDRKTFAEDISGVRKFAKLPMQLQKLLKEIEKFCGCKIAGVGVGPEREQFVKV